MVKRFIHTYLMQNLVSHTLQIRPLSQTPFSLSIGLGYGYFLYTQSLHPCSVQKSHRSYFTFAVRSFLQQKHAPVMGMTFSGLSLVLPPSFLVSIQECLILKMESFCVKSNWRSPTLMYCFLFFQNSSQLMSGIISRPSENMSANLSQSIIKFLSWFLF